MTEQKVYLKDLHFEHKAWESEIKLAKDEVNSFENRLEEVVSKNSNKDMLAQLEHLQNQFIREKEVIDQLLHDIHKHESALQQYAEDHPVAIEHQYFRDHAGLRDQVEQFRKIFAQLKAEFARFLAKWM